LERIFPALLREDAEFAGTVHRVLEEMLSSGVRKTIARINA
jgi:hypothetical protein